MNDQSIKENLENASRYQNEMKQSLSYTAVKLSKIHCIVLWTRAIAWINGSAYVGPVKKEIGCWMALVEDGTSAWILSLEYQTEEMLLKCGFLIITKCLVVMKEGTLWTSKGKKIYWANICLSCSYTFLDGILVNVSSLFKPKETLCLQTMWMQ